jgi:ribonuclease T2
MLRPHLLLTILLFAALGAYIAHFMSQQRSLPSLPGGTVTSGPATTGASSGTLGGGNTDADGASDRNRQRNTQTANDSDNGDWSSGSDQAGGDRNVAGQFDYYALVLSWSPTYCSDQGRDDDGQCNRRDGRRYSFVLHGLWPQYESGYPTNCRLSRRPFVPDPVINSMLDIMPSRGLVIHEYRTHGTCSGLAPQQYFSIAHRLFDAVTVPERFRNPFESQIISSADVKREFLRANPQLGAGALTVVCGGAGGMLREVRICLTKDGVPRGCGQNETRQNLCTANQVFVPPSRSTARNWGNEQPVQLPTAPRANGQSPDHLPGPR